jgi:hypothetical protein
MKSLENLRIIAGKMIYSLTETGVTMLILIKEASLCFE